MNQWKRLPCTRTDEWPLHGPGSDIDPVFRFLMVACLRRLEGQAAAAMRRCAGAHIGPLGTLARPHPRHTAFMPSTAIEHLQACVDACSVTHCTTTCNAAWQFLDKNSESSLRRAPAGTRPHRRWPLAPCAQRCKTFGASCWRCNRPASAPPRPAGASCAACCLPSMISPRFSVRLASRTPASCAAARWWSARVPCVPSCVTTRASSACCRPWRTAAPRSPPTTTTL